MKIFKQILSLFISIFILCACSDDDWITSGDFRICATKCLPEKPWTVETLDLERPCFETKEACLEWASTHGYSDKKCLKCD